MNMMGMTVMKQVVGDKTGYQEAQGQKKVMEAEEFTNMKQQSFPFLELQFLNNKDVSLTGIEYMNSKEVYVIVYKNSKFYYDTKTGLRIAVENISKKDGAEKSDIISYDDYVDVKGIKFPYKMTMDVGMSLEFITQDVKINEGVTEKDFE
jgi:hypothetical protein